jgi:hypothetical protein
VKLRWPESETARIDAALQFSQSSYLTHLSKMRWTLSTIPADGHESSKPRDSNLGLASTQRFLPSEVLRSCKTATAPTDML